MDDDRFLGTSVYDELLEHFGGESPSFWLMSQNPNEPLNGA